PLYPQSLVENRTEERRLAEELARARRIEAIGRLAGGVAHDVNNMLAVILGYTEIIGRQLGDDHELAPELAEISRAAEHSRALARELLAFGRRQVLARAPVAPGAVIAALSGLLRSTLGADVRLTVRDESAGAIVLGDQAQFESVVVNLVANARDAMPQGGEVTVRIAVSGPDQGAEHGAVQISVTDTGEGMPEQVREHIFEPFFTTKELGQGTGLGLATVVGVVEQMGGTVAVESAPGTGSTFVVTLPRAPEDAEAQAPDASDAPDDQGAAARATVLVVEDEPQVLGLVQRLLEGAGYTVVCAAAGEQALAMLRNRHLRLDLLLTDMILPDLPGAELASAAVALRPGIRIVYTSGYTGEIAVREGMPPGDGFIAKPYTSAELLAVVEAALRPAR
ncbi:MAG: ATP-binding protein, partial [Solirubrobacteraceae bacterium]